MIEEKSLSKVLGEFVGGVGYILIISYAFMVTINFIFNMNISLKIAVCLCICIGQIVTWLSKIFHGSSSKIVL